MTTFFVCLSLLVAAYFLYGRYLDKVCRIDPAARVPSEKLYDGVDYMPMPRWRVFPYTAAQHRRDRSDIRCRHGCLFRSGGLFVDYLRRYISPEPCTITYRASSSCGTTAKSLPEVVAIYLGSGVGTRAEVVLAGAADTGGRGIPAFAGSHTLRHDRHVDVSLAGRYRRLLLRGHAHAHRQDHRPRLSGVRGLRSS